MIIVPMKNMARAFFCGTKRARWVGDAERTPVDFGEAERRVVGRDDDVGVAGEPDAAAEAEALHRRDDGHLAVVHGRERLVAAAVHADERVVGRVGGELFDVDAGLEALALGAQDHAPATSGSRPAARSASASGTSRRPGVRSPGGLSIVTIATCSRVSERIMRGAYFRRWT